MRALRTLVVAGALVAGLLIGPGVLIPDPALARGVDAGSPAHAAPRDPVVIVPGTLAGDPLVEIDIQTMAGALRSEGYAVFIYWLPGNGLGDMAETAEGLSPFVEDVLGWTGADAVDIIAHSQGGLLARWYVRFLGGDAVVDDLVSLGTPHYGTKLANLGSLFGLWNCLGFGACTQAAVGSAFLAELNAGDDAPGDVHHTSFTTRLDLIVVPYTNALLQGDGTTNVVIQQQCPLRVVEHLGMPSDAAVQDGVFDALADRPVSLDCAAIL